MMVMMEIIGFNGDLSGSRHGQEPDDNAVRARKEITGPPKLDSASTMKNFPMAVKGE
jgi:hypothetical protein